MKKHLGIIFLLIMTFAMQTMVFAAPKTMPDGALFDAEFYAASNPDVVAIYGATEARLYEHYKDYGKKEGRLAVMPSAPSVPNTAIVTPDVSTIIANDIINCFATGAYYNRRDYGQGFGMSIGDFHAYPFDVTTVRNAYVNTIRKMGHKNIRVVSDFVVSKYNGLSFDTIIYYDNSGAINNGVPCTSMTIRQIPIGK